jgi:intracellular multiplication protein IcmG
MKKQASAPAPAAVKPAPAPTSKPAATKTVTAPAATQTPSQPTKAASVSWKLQGAQPGKAWLTRSTGGEPVTVTTGAYLPGLGRVNFIGQREGRWMVEGSEGRVSE